MSTGRSPEGSGSDEGPALLPPQLQEARREFLTLVEGLRPDLHRYCARMTGSVSDGEDVVQETLARAYYELSALKEPPALRSWLFRIAHNKALDQLRRYERRMGEPFDIAVHERIDDAPDPDALMAREQAVAMAVARFVELVPTQRSCVILKDVLECSLEEIAALLDLSVLAVKAALHRGRTRLRELAQEPEQPASPRPASQTVRRYADLFNARDWDGVRAMLADDVRLDLVAASKRRGRKEVAVYFTNYDRLAHWYMQPAWLDGREVLAVLKTPGETQPMYFIEITTSEDRITTIRDFNHVPYIAQDAVIVFAR
jgi:RNA polymerase sigma factor (sigma-70 family)